MERILAVDIGGTYIKYGLIGKDMTVEEHYSAPTPEAQTTEELFNYICSHIRSLEGVTCIGVSSPGLIDENSCVRSYAAPKLAALYGADIAAEMKSRTGKFTAAINDARAAGLCEFKMGTAKGSALAVCLIIGTGGGGCILTENGLFHGVDNFAGEFHFLSYYNEKTGEDMKSGRTIGMFGLVNRYNEKADANHQVTEGRTVIERSFAGEELAVSMVGNWIHRVALQCLNIAVIINPEMICIGGGISAENWFLERVKKEYAAICESHFNGVHFLSTRIERCRFQNDSNLLGAALQVMEKAGQK